MHVLLPDRLERDSLAGLKNNIQANLFNLNICQNARYTSKKTNARTLPGISEHRTVSTAS